MNQIELFKLIDKFEGTKLTKLIYEVEGVSICLEKDGLGSSVKAQNMPIVEQITETPIEIENSNNIDIKSPLAGVFYKASSPDDEPYVKVGQNVKKGQIVCLVEAMKLMNEITAPCDGIIQKVLVENGDVVSFEQKLFEVEPC